MASVLKVDKLDPQGGTALEIGTSGDTISIPSGATLDISASTLTPPATMPASSGINFTALNATNLGSGTVPTARLGTGSASSSVFLAGDSTWIAAGGGKVLQAVTTQFTTSTSTSSTSWVATGLSVDITPSATSSKVLVFVSDSSLYHDAGSNFHMTVYRDATNLGHATYGSMYGYGKGDGETFCSIVLDSPSTTSAVTYEMYGKCIGGTLYWSNGNAASNITAIEIGA